MQRDDTALGATASDRYSDAAFLPGILPIVRFLGGTDAKQLVFIVGSAAEVGDRKRRIVPPH
jgi:hypothetical protein